ncbi:MAG: hypothetical protein K940chlam1_00872 [Candidatus Anoxychlamydiales bacterium]|nr:hypothetical protein [Candidatus Anoxychlamydiales bacterium]NGX36567.1 hypothetical protein [Candidatus Anoxychlamydiales bacterium]
MIFEMIMLICFGIAWPLAVYKSHKTKSTKGKSIAFLYTIFIGYMSGIIYKAYYNYDWVIYLYVLNSLMVLLDISLYHRNKRLIIL